MTFKQILLFTTHLGACGLVVVGCATQSIQTQPESNFGSTSSHAGELPAREVHALALPEQPSLTDYLRYAALNNPGLEAAFYQWKVALEKVPQARALPDPRFNYAYFVEQVETRVGPQRQRFGISQTFPWFGKLRLRGSKSGEAAIAAQMEYEQRKLKLYAEVKDAYFELGYLRRAIDLTEENIELIKHLESAAQARFRTGSDVTGVVKAQVELGKLEDKLRALQELRDPLSARLNAALNRDSTAPVAWPSEPDPTRVALDEAVMVEQIIAANPELSALDAKVRESELGVKLARKKFFPDLTLGIDYVETQDARLSGVAGSGKDPIMIMGSVQMPLWLGKHKAGLREAEARLSAANKQREEREGLLLADLKMALYRYHDAERKISLFGDTLDPLARNSLDVAEQAYRSGRADFLELIDAQRLLLDVQLSYHRSIADREQQLAQIERMVGASFEELLGPAEKGDSRL